MAIQVGDQLPAATFFVMGSQGVEPKTTDDIFAGRVVVLVGVPGAFTPTCHRNHLPGYIEQAEALKGRGIDAIAVTSVNDVFVMDAWARETGGAGKVTFLADGNADFARAIGMSFDASAHGLGTRSNRYVMTVRHGVVASLTVEEQNSRADLSSAAALLVSMAQPPT